MQAQHNRLKAYGAKHVGTLLGCQPIRVQTRNSVAATLLTLLG
jgi:hypothetical protein